MLSPAAPPSPIPSPLLDPSLINVLVQWHEAGHQQGPEISDEAQPVVVFSYHQVPNAQAKSVAVEQFLLGQGGVVLQRGMQTSA